MEVNLCRITWEITEAEMNVRSGFSDMVSTLLSYKHFKSMSKTPVGLISRNLKPVHINYLQINQLPPSTFSWPEIWRPIGLSYFIGMF